MYPYLRIGLYVIYGIGLLLLGIFSGSKFDWMAQFDPSISLDAIEDGSGNRQVFLIWVLLLASAAQLVIMLKARSTWERLSSALLIVVAVIVFAV